MGIAERLKHWLFDNPDIELVTALFDNDPLFVAFWLTQGADPNIRHTDGRTLLFLAAERSRDPAIAERLLAGGADPRLHDRYGQTPLHVAAVFGTEAHLRVLLDGGAEIDARDRRGVTPLHITSGLGRLEEATLLVSRGADVGIRDRQGRTPLDHVREHPHEPLSKRRWEAFERLLGGFLTVKIVEVQANSLKVRVESVHSNFLEAERRARERGALTLPCGDIDAVPEPGDILRCAKGLSPGEDKIWRASQKRRHDLDLTR